MNLKLNPITIFAPNVLAGAERVVICGLNEFAKNNFPIEIIIIKEIRSPQNVENFIKLLSPKIKIHIIETKNPVDFFLILKIQKLLRNLSRKESIIHTHGYKALIFTYFANFFTKISHVHTHHGNTSHTLKVKFYEFIAAKVMNNISRVIAVSSNMKNELSNEIKNNNIATIENMLSFENTEDIINSRSKLVRNNILNLVFVGRLSPEKGSLHFLNIFSNCPFKEMFNLTFVGDGPEREAMEKIIIENHLDKNVSMTGFVINPKEFYIRADALIMPSFTEGLPMTLIEALCCGIPVLATGVGAISSIVENLNNGLIVSINNQENWNSSLEIFAKKFESLRVNAENQIPNVMLRFSANRWMKETFNLYSQVLESESSAR